MPLLKPQSFPPPLAPTARQMWEVEKVAEGRPRCIWCKDTPWLHQSFEHSASGSMNGEPLSFLFLFFFFLVGFQMRLHFFFFFFSVVAASNGIFVFPCCRG